MRYANRYARLLANSAPVDPDNPQSCWLWTGKTDRYGYGRLAVRVRPRPATPQLVAAHRAMLEELLGATFPFDEGGHLCYVRGCIHPDHLEVQTSALNLSERRGYAQVDGCLIPTLFPRVDPLQHAADRAWDEPGEPADACPF